MLQSKPTKFAVLAAHAKSLTARIKLPAPVAAIYRAVAELEAYASEICPGSGLAGALTG